MHKTQCSAKDASVKVLINFYAKYLKLKVPGPVDVWLILVDSNPPFHLYGYLL